MSRTVDHVKEEFAPVETVAESDGFEVVKDCDGDYWIGRWPKQHEYTMITQSQTHAFAEVLADADLLPDEYQPDDPTRSPEDVAETWIKAETDPGNQSVYVPLTAEFEVGEGRSHLEFRSEYPMLCEQFDGEYIGGWFACETIEHVNAADVPFSEVPVDE